MVNKEFFAQVREQHVDYVSKLKKMINKSNNVVSLSKRAIFALHRGKIEDAKQLIDDAQGLLLEIQKNLISEEPGLAGEGALRAGQEEFVEALFFYNVLIKEKIDFHPKLQISREAYLGGVCDLTGEIIRHTVKLASNREFDEVKKMHQILEDIMGELIEFDLTGYLRTKYDQAKNSLRKIEQIEYDIEMRSSKK